MYKRILIPTDGSSISTAAGRAGVAFAKQCGAEVVGIYVAPEYHYPYPTYNDAIPQAYPTEEEYKADVRKAGEQYLDEIKQPCTAAGLKFSEVIVFSDKPAQQIIEAASKHGCDMVFMGSHGRGGWGQLLLGSVTTKVLHACDIPVLVYRLTRQPAH